MNETKQVDKDQYEFLRYMSKARWNSLWHQLDEVIRLKPERVLEIGPGLDVFKNTAGLYGVKVETLDIDPELKPDHVGSATALPLTTTALMSSARSRCSNIYLTKPHCKPFGK